MSAFDQYFERVLELHPSFASFLGDMNASDRVEVSLDPRHQRRLADLHREYATIASAMPKGVERDLLLHNIERFQEAKKLPLDLMPFTSYENPITSITFSEGLHARNSANMRKRHACYVTFFKHAMDRMREGVRKGITPPKRICQAAIRDGRRFLEKKQYLPRDEYKGRDKDVAFLERAYAPEIARFLEFAESEYLPECTDAIGIGQLGPIGKAMYRHMILDHTTLKITPEEISAMGRAEVRRISAQLRRIMPKLFLDPRTRPASLEACVEAMRGDPRHVMKSRKEALDAFRGKLSELRSTIVKDLFPAQVAPCRVTAVPASLQRSMAGAFYLLGGTSRIGTFYVNVRDLKEVPTYVLETLCMHEGEPGHHYQFQYMIERGLPKSRIYGVNSTAFVEGWALYAESLSKSNDPLTVFGRLTYDMLRAVRCVVDTGIHYYGWTYERAFAYMRKYVAAKDSEIHTELERYICLPAQATAYKVGERFFLKLRKMYEVANPSAPLSAFHAAVLDDGILPLNILERKFRP